LLPLAAMTALVVALVLLVPDGEMWWVAMLANVAAGLALPPRLAAGAAAGLVGLTVACAWLTTGRFDFVLLLQVAFAASAIAIRQLTIAVAQLRAAREELARLAVAEERLRFARDLHDLLGHSLSVIVLKSELAGRLLPAAPERAAAEVGDVEHAAREALRQVRAAVADYRQPTLHGELAAARELLAAAGIAVDIDQHPGPLPPTLDGLLAWAVREGVTNVIRHSRARRCAIRVSHHDGLARVEVADDGRGAGGSTATEGSGLAGLAERAAAHGGRLQAGSLPQGGFRLLVEAPIAGTGDGRTP
jgi:two-component system sensor histidine kinase DesK